MCRLSIFYSVFGPRVELDALCAESTPRPESWGDDHGPFGCDPDDGSDDLRDARVEKFATEMDEYAKEPIHDFD